MITFKGLHFPGLLSSPQAVEEEVCQILLWALMSRGGAVEHGGGASLSFDCEMSAPPNT